MTSCASLLGCSSGDGGSHPPSLPDAAAKADSRRAADGATSGSPDGPASAVSVADAATTTDAAPASADAVASASDARSGAPEGGARDATTTGGADGPPPAGTLAVASQITLPEPLMFGKGLVWLAGPGKLVFSDYGNDKTWELAPPAAITLLRSPAGKPTGLAVDPQGRLIVCEAEGIFRATPGGPPEMIDGAGCNDLVVRGDGTIFATEYSAGRVVRLTPGKSRQVVDAGTALPNGIALSPDGSTLYASFEKLRLLKRYRVAADGSTGPGETFGAGVMPARDLGGLAVDDAGDLYVSGDNVIVVLKPDGTRRGQVAVGVSTTNLAFGGPDRKTLYILGRTRLYEARLSSAGPP